MQIVGLQVAEGVGQGLSILDAASLRRKIVTPAKALALLHKSPAFPTRRVRMRIAQRF
jgi:hypothetical protein